MHNTPHSSKSRSVFGQAAGRPLYRRVEQVQAEIVGRKAGRAGMMASVLMAFVGILFGALASYIGGRGNDAEARYSGFETVYQLSVDDNVQLTTSGRVSPLRQGNSVRVRAPDEQKLRSKPTLRDQAARIFFVSQAGDDHDRLSQASLTDPTEQEVTPPLVERDYDANVSIGSKPKVAIIFDDVGLDRKAFDQLMALPGPLTLSFLPYGQNLQSMVDRAAAKGHGIMLHLPMEPVGRQNPGPHALKTGTTGSLLLKDLEWNLNRFTGFDGVNNHMGSKLTADLNHMITILGVLKSKDLFFVDSVTTSHTKAREAGRRSGTTVLQRDVFLDPDAGRETVRRQLAEVEEIAMRTGFAIAIAHPHTATIDMIGPWLTSTSLRGFELVTVSEFVKGAAQDGGKKAEG